MRTLFDSATSLSGKSVILVRLAGGLGNQMFQYAAARRLAHVRGAELKMDLGLLLDRTPRKNFAFRDYELNIFNVRQNFASPREVFQFTGKPGTRAGRLWRRVEQRLRPRVVIAEPHFEFFPALLDAPDNAYLRGYWQSEKYFADIASIIKKEFTPAFTPPRKVLALEQEIASRQSVGIQIRRTDAVTNPNSHHMNLDYFEKGIRHLAGKIERPHFYVFSDDMNWCEAHIRAHHPVTFITDRNAGGSFRDHFYLLSGCKHFIISNSTFGWWAAWLSPHQEKHVVVPNDWFGKPEPSTKDLIPKTWIRI